MELSERKILKLNAIAVILAFVTGFSMAILSREKYSVINNYISDLGVGNGAAWFNNGVIITGVLLFSFFALLSKRFEKNSFSTLGIALGLIASIGLVCVGVFPEDIELYHYAASVTFFLVAAIAVLLLSLAKKQKNKLVYVPAALFLLSSIALLSTTERILEHTTVLTFGIWLLATAFSKN